MAFGIIPSNSGATINNNYNGATAYQIGSLTVWKQQLYYNKAPTLEITDHWDNAFSPTNFSLDATQLIATTLGIGGNIRNVLAHTTGNYYFEIQQAWNSPLSRSFLFGVGVASIGANLPALQNANFSGLWTDIPPAPYNNWDRGTVGVTASGMPAPSFNAWIGIAAKLNNGGFLDMWMCNASADPFTFYGNGGVGDPVAGTNPFRVATYGAPVYIYAGNNGNVAGIPLAYNTSVFTGFAPVGYVGWAANLTPDNDPTHWGLVAPNPPPCTYANLPTNIVEGEIAIITDSTTAVVAATISGGGANAVLAWYNGAVWKVLQAV